MPRLAIASLLTLCGTTLAAPFTAEPLVKVGDVVDGLIVPEARIIGRPTINSHGEWAVSVSSGQILSNDFFSSLVLGNDGVRIASGTLPNGQPAPDRIYYRDVDMNDAGQLAVGISWIGVFRLGEIYVDDRIAALSLTGTTSIERGRINNAGILQVEDEGVFGNFYSTTVQTDSGEWLQEGFYLGRNVVTPVGRVINDVLNIENSAIGPDGAILYSALYDFEDANGKVERKRALAKDDAFVAIEGEPASFGNFLYGNSPGGAVAINSHGMFAFRTGLRDQASPSQTGSAILREDGSPLVSTFDDIPSLNDFGAWAISGEFGLSDQMDVLWRAATETAISPDVPPNFGSQAILFNDQILMKTGDLAPDGALIYQFSSWELSANGQWAIVSARAEIPGVGLEQAIYRFQIPTPAPTGLIVGMALWSSRRRR